ncbi:MAG: hypothetical protein AAF658_08035 [Myxococcota bacterium]
MIKGLSALSPALAQAGGLEGALSKPVERQRAAVRQNDPGAARLIRVDEKAPAELKKPEVRTDLIITGSSDWPDERAFIVVRDEASYVQRLNVDSQGLNVSSDFELTVPLTNIPEIGSVDEIREVRVSSLRDLYPGEAIAVDEGIRFGWNSEHLDGRWTRTSPTVVVTLNDGSNVGLAIATTSMDLDHSASIAQNVAKHEAHLATESAHDPLWQEFYAALEALDMPAARAVLERLEAQRDIFTGQALRDLPGIEEALANAIASENDETVSQAQRALEAEYFRTLARENGERLAADTRSSRAHLRSVTEDSLERDAALLASHSPSNIRTSFTRHDHGDAAVFVIWNLTIGRGDAE